jgi:hypothetical protein
MDVFRTIDLRECEASDKFTIDSILGQSFRFALNKILFL